MRKRALLNLILFFCLMILGVNLFVQDVLAIDSNCYKIDGSAVQDGKATTVDFSRLLFDDESFPFQFRGCVRPTGVGEYAFDGWILNYQLGWLSLKASTNPNNPAQKLNSNVVVNSSYEYGVKILREKVNGKEIAKLRGYFWGDNIGWIKMNCEPNPDLNYDQNQCGAQQYGVEVDFSKPVAGKPDYYSLKGHAWSENFGYINFSGVQVRVPVVNYNFKPRVTILDGDTPNYANSAPTDQGIFVVIEDPNGRNVTDIFRDSGFQFCLMFDDRRTLDGVTRLDSTEFSLADDSCTSHVDDQLNIFDSRTAFEYDASKKFSKLRPGSYPRSYLSTQSGDLELAVLNLINPDPNVPDVKFPIRNKFLTFQAPYEVALVQANSFGSAPSTVEEVFEKKAEAVEFSYGNQEDYYLAIKVYRGELLDNSIEHEIGFTFSDEDLVDVSMTLTLPDLDGEEGDLVVQNVGVPTNFGDGRYDDFYTLESAYDLPSDELLVPMKIQMDKMNPAISNQILATNIVINSGYSFAPNSSSASVNTLLESERLRTVEFETFETFTKGFLQDRAFKSVFDDSRTSGVSNYALFRSKINQFVANSLLRSCSLTEVLSNACNVTAENQIIFIAKQDVDNQLLDLNTVYNEINSIHDRQFTLITEGFDFYLGEDFVRSDDKRFGLIALQNVNNLGGRMMVETDVNNIINSFVYLDKNFMSVDSYDRAVALAESYQENASILSFAQDDSYNQLVFSGQLISNNCSGCSRSIGDKPAQFADGRLVLNDDDLVLAQLDDINFVRYSPLVFNVDREGDSLFELNCDGERVLPAVPLDLRRFFTNFSSDKLCFKPEKLGFDGVTYSSTLGENPPKNKIRSFMMFYQDPDGLPVFGTTVN